MTRFRSERIDMAVRNATGVADIRVRPMWREWSADLRIRYDADQFTLNEVTNLLARVWTAEKVPALDWAFSGLIESQPMPRRISILIHTLAVAIISALAWWHHDPALVLAYVSGALIEWDMTT